MVNTAARSKRSTATLRSSRSRLAPCSKFNGSKAYARSTFGSMFKVSERRRVRVRDPVLVISG
jgi:hypothetical protein